MIRRLVLGVALVLSASCGGGGTEAVNSGVDTGPVATIVVTTPSSAVAVGQSLQLKATLSNASGGVLTGLAVTWASAVPSVASVSASGLVTALSTGSTTISVTSGAVTGSVLITVTPVGVQSVTITSPTTALAVGSTLQLTANVTGANGLPLTGQTIIWTSSDPTKATVSSTGLVTGIGSAVTPHVTTVAPTTITAGATIAITGSNFATTTNGVSVTVAGIPLLVTAATATQLSASVPPTFPCISSGSTTLAVANTIGGVTITASVGGQSGTTALTVGSTPATSPATLQVATQLTLAVGQAVLLSDPTQVACNELTGTGAHYLISVYNVSGSETAFSSFELRGAAGPLTAANVLASAARSATPKPALPARRLAPTPLTRGPISGTDGAWLHMRDGHAQRLARTSALAQPMMQRMKAQRLNATAKLNANVAATAVGATVIPQTVGATVTLKVDTIGCSDSWVNVKARVVYVGTASIILEATDSPLAGTMDADYVKLGQTFDNVQYPIITQYFGNPFAFDDSLSNIGKVTMLFTKLVNGGGGELGFVTPCDFFPPADDAEVPSSNHTEMFYGYVPTEATGSLADFNVRAVWDLTIPATVIHETKHVTAMAERFADPAGDSLEQSWMEEATAQVAAEMYGRTVYATYGAAAAAWKGNETYDNSVYYDVRSVTPYIMADHFSWLYGYLQDNEEHSILSAGYEDADIYGSAWLFARWMLDQYSTQESDILKPLIADATMAGIQNVTNKTGRSWEELDGYFTLALEADDYPGFTPPAGARYIVPSWNLRSIYTGFNADFGSSQFTAWPLVTHPVSFGAWVTDVQTLIGASGSIFDLTGTQSGPQLLDLHSLSGAPLPAGHSLRMVIVRLQ